MDDDLLTLMRTNAIFSSLSYRTRQKLLPKFERIELEKGDYLYHQGDVSDSVEIILSGQLEALLTSSTGDMKFIRDILPGETIGVLEVLTGQLRSMSIIATRNSVLFKLSSEYFIELCHQYPAVLYAIINPIVSSSQRLISTLAPEKFKKHIAIIPANDQVDLSFFSTKMTELISEVSSIILLSDYDSSLLVQTVTQIHHVIEEAKNKLINKKIKQRIIYLLKPNETTLAKYAFERAEMIYVVGDVNAPILINNYVMDAINQFRLATKLNPELIILHRPNTKLPRGTANWLQLTQFGLHHHVRADVNADFQRLIRFMRNKAVGVVLSGGGTRGWAHAGAIMALTEAGIPIDAVGGTSVGAVIGASYALSLSDEKTLAQFREIIEATRYSVSLRSLTWPAISLFNAKGLTSILEKLFGDFQIEDLWIPYFCVSTNLAKNSETIHRYGSLWEQIRCSVSIPGVIPPTVLSGELHFDGGLLNNLPIDIMRKLVSSRGTIVGVELVSYSIDENKYFFPPILTFWQTLLAKLGIFYKYKFPPFIDTFLKSLLAGSSVKAKQNSLDADILVALDLSKFPMLYSNKKQENQIIEIGYESTMHYIKNMKRKNKL